MSWYEKYLNFSRKKKDICAYIKIPGECLLSNGWSLNERIIIEISKDVIIITKDNIEKMELEDYTWLEE